MNGCLLGAAIALTCGQMAFAAPELQLVSGGTSTPVLIGSGNTVSFSGTVGGWDVFLTVGTSNSPNVSGSGGGFGLDLTALTATCIGGDCTSDPLDIFLSDVGFTQAVGTDGFVNAFNTTQSGGTATQTAWVATDNQYFSQATLIGTVGPFTGSNAGSVNGGGPAGPSAYSLTIEDIFTSGGSPAVIVVQDGQISATPEPGVMVLFGTVLLVCGTQFRRRAQKS